MTKMEVMAARQLAAAEFGFSRWLIGIERAEKNRRGDFTMIRFHVKTRQRNTPAKYTMVKNSLGRWELMVIG